MIGYAFILLLALTLVAAVLGHRQASRLRAAPGHPIHSRPIYHALNAAILTGVPALIALAVGLVMSGPIVDAYVLSTIASADDLDPARRDLIMSQVRQAAAGIGVGEVTPEIRAAAARLGELRVIAFALVAVVAAALAAVGGFFALRAIGPRFRARHRVEGALTGFMLASALVAILTTTGIVVSLVYEAAAFFSLVPITDFLFGLRWEPQIAIRADQLAGQGAFGVIPVLWGTLVIAALAMAVAIPIGILSAVYLTEFAHPRARAIIKPMLEILAGIPSVVYGFFAILTVAPAVRQLALSLGIPASPNSALAAGAVMGVMIIPFVSSISDDALAAVPRAMRDGSYALGATKGETVRKVLLPAALPGIMGGVLLAFSRAIGETMVVVMAAGLIATLALNPLDSVTTVTVQIVTLLIGDAEFDNPKTLAAFALGLLLFLITLVLNLIALHIVRRYREKY